MIYSPDMLHPAIRSKVHRLEKNCGPAAARNHGIERAKSPLILIVGDDISPDRKMVWGHVVAHKQYPQQNIAILGKVVWPSNIPINTLMKHIDGIGAQQFSYHYLKMGPNTISGISILQISLSN